MTNMNYEISDGHWLGTPDQDLRINFKIRRYTVKTAENKWQPVAR